MLEIDGHEVIWDEFVNFLDRARWDFANFYRREEEKARQYNSAIVPIQDMVFDWVYGEDSCTPEEISEKYVSLKTGYPPALQQSLDKLLDRAVVASRQIKDRRDSERAQERAKVELVMGLVDVETYDFDIPAASCAAMAELAKAKEEQGGYEVTAEEREAMSLWCDLCVGMTLSDRISYGQMRRLVEVGALTEGEVSGMLSDLGDRRDYEWYSEDFMGMRLFDETILPFDRVLNMALPGLRRLIHVR